jgi:hypothetical protein
MKQKPSSRRRRNSTKSVLRLPDLEQRRGRAEISKLNAAVEEWIPRHYLTDRERTIKKLTKPAAEQAAEDTIVLRESFPGLACVRRYWLFVLFLFLDAGLADFFFASPSRPPIRVKASAALNGN